MKELTPAERLIVAADFKPVQPEAGSPSTVRDVMRTDVQVRVRKLIRNLKGTGVCIKVNSALRAIGYDLIDEIHEAGLAAFADLKLFDIGNTLADDGALLSEFRPDILTTVCAVGDAAMKALKAELPDTEVLGVTVLTSLDESETYKIFGTSIGISVMKLAGIAENAGVDGLICSPWDIVPIRNMVKGPLTFNTPAIRPTWAIVPGDDQNPERIMTPAKAIKAGAHRIVVGRPITKPSEGMSSYDAVMRTIDEIAAATQN